MVKGTSFSHCESYTPTKPLYIWGTCLFNVKHEANTAPPQERLYRLWLPLLRLKLSKTFESETNTFCDINGIVSPKDVRPEDDGLGRHPPSSSSKFENLDCRPLFHMQMGTSTQIQIQQKTTPRGSISNARFPFWSNLEPVLPLRNQKTMECDNDKETSSAAQNRKANNKTTIQPMPLTPHWCWT
jgi:hypothetical protein